MKMLKCQIMFLVLLLGRVSLSEDPASDDGYCTKDDGCPATIENDDDERGEARGGAGEGAVDKGRDSPTQRWNIYSTISDAVTSVKDAVAYKAYKAAEKVYNTTTKFASDVYEAVEDFSERVRYVFREEFSAFLELVWETAVGEKAADNTAFQKVRRYFYIRILIAILVVLCLLLDYVIWNLSYNILTAFIWILTLNSAVLLAYKVLGAEVVLWVFWKAVGYGWYTGILIWSYPYTSASLICLLFLFSILCSVYLWRRGVERREWNKDMISSIHRRLLSIEEQQKKIAKQNEVLQRQMEELLRLSSSSDNSI